MKADKKLAVCKATRAIAAKALYNALQGLLNQDGLISEIQLRDTWLANLRKNRSIFPDGWYDPPPHGVGVLIGTDMNTDRINFPSLRPQEFWPKEDIFLDRNNGILVCYISPVDRETGIIGDFGITLYFGKNEEFRKHLKICLDSTYEIFEHMKVGMTLSEVSRITHDILSENRITSNLASPSDPTGTNTGHTIPRTDCEWTNEELKILKNIDWSRVKNLISNKRKFVNSIEQLRIQPEMGVTIEPRLRPRNNPAIPTVLFHAISLFKEDGGEELLSNFDKIFRLVGMDYMLKTH